MRISSNTLFENGVNNMLARQQEVAETQAHISTGRRVLAPSDDPVAAAQMLDVAEAKALNQQYADNAAAVNTCSRAFAPRPRRSRKQHPAWLLISAMKAGAKWR